MTAPMPDLSKAAGVIADALRRAREIVHSDAEADTTDFEAGYVLATLHDAGLLLPEGFVAVPREPTEAMSDAALNAGLDIYWNYREGGPNGGPADVYRAMIQAQEKQG